MSVKGIIPQSSFRFFLKIAKSLVIALICRERG
jgi:hypothetical protein